MLKPVCHDNKEDYLYELFEKNLKEEYAKLGLSKLFEQQKTGSLIRKAMDESIKSIIKWIDSPDYETFDKNELSYGQGVS